MLSGRLPPGVAAEGSAAGTVGRVPGKKPRIVAIGGGTGLPVVLRGLSGSDGVAADPDGLTAVVTVTDDGGSSGRLRHQFGVLPPGDVRNCLVALARDGCPAAQFLQHRFSPDATGEAGHAV